MSFSSKKAKRLMYAFALVTVTYITTGYVDLTILKDAGVHVPIDKPTMLA